MPFLVRIHSGTVNIIACDIDGYANPAVQALGDTAACTVAIVDSVLGASRYDSNGTKIAEGTSIVQASKTAQTAADRATLSLTRVQVDPAIEAAGGKSLRIGSTVLDQFASVDVSFTTGSGSPAVSVFEDYPTMVGTSVPSSEAFDVGQIKLTNPLVGQSVESGEAFDEGNVAYDQSFAGVPVESGEAFDQGTINSIGLYPGLSVPSSEAFDVGQIVLRNRLVGVSVPSSEAFTAGRLMLLLAGSSVASSEGFTVGAMRLVNRLLGVSVPSSEAFTPGNLASQRFLVGQSVESDEAFTPGNMHLHLPGADDPPVLLAPGRVQPNGDVLEGTALVATVGAWSGFPSAARFVWLADGDVVHDSGLQDDVWSDTYTPTSSDVGKTITVEESTSNDVGESDPVASLALIDVHALPPAFVGHDEVFGPMPSVADVWGALQATIRLWLPTYLRERERLSGRAYGVLPAPRGWRIFTESLDSDPGDQLPLCVIVAPGVPDALVKNGDGVMHGRMELGVSILVSASGGDDRSGTILLAGEYGAALRSMLAQHGSLGGVVNATSIIGERYDEITSESQGTLAAAEVVISVRLSGLARFGGGPSEPLPDPIPPDDPGAPVLGTVATTELDLERV